ncbi:MAG: 23S rRNA (pseudouridine(1915)-N(3))-methyltransferase RlmH [Coxiellaceae bacterium]|nr:23S rRNA (pseudouridine(1915)-N(3))-methyltransferase RlmH [Coxiellaceae bacterium]
MPKWVAQGFEEYQKRLPKQYALQLVEIAAEKRYNDNLTEKILDIEADKIIKQLKPGEHIVTLDRLGKKISTQDLAKQLQLWHDDSVSIAIVIGGAEGIAKKLLVKGNTCWSLSALTFPHPLVRIVIAEQLYRAYSIITGHPYHK